MIDAVNFVDQQFPALGKQVWKALYSFLAWRFPQAEWTFMNYGYASDGPPLPLDAEDELNRYFIQLYARVLDWVDLRDCAVLEVGCGRGGGSAWLARTQSLKSMTGLDLSPQAVRLCRRLHAHPHLNYVQGEAGQLPFAEGSFDLVINVESAHHYPDLDRFLAEVHRVLRPGGHFWTVDYREPETVPALEQALAAAELSLLAFNDITPNVVQALDHTEAYKRELIQRHVPAYLRPLVETFAAVDGSEVHQRFVSGRLPYLEAWMQKPLETATHD